MSSATTTTLFIPHDTLQSTLSITPFLCMILFISILAFIFPPGGLAWALSKTRSKTAIPGPTGLPVLGLVFIFTSKLTHRLLEKISTSFNAKKLMSFSIGMTRFVIASHPDTAKEILNSTSFADRPIKESAYSLLFHRAMGFAPYGEYWRNLRKISATHLFSNKRVAGFGTVRKDIGLKMVKKVLISMESNGFVEVKKMLHYGSLNNVMMTVFGKCYEDFNENGDGFELEKMVSEGYELLSIFNWSDHFPIIGWFDLQGVRKRCKCLVSKVNVFVGNIIKEHRVRRAKNSGAEGVCGADFVDVLLDLESEDKFTDDDMIAVLWEMIFRGTDTVAILLEWILARMVMHPEIQARAQAEINSVVVGSGQSVTDADLPNLPYLHAIVKETLRVHPPGPLLSWARLAINDTQVGPHMVPAGTTAMVNMWAITHDDKIWDEPEKFNPDRFMSEEVSVMGTDLRLAPFGAGRRVCPGKTMGLATVQLWLAQLLQNFTWVGTGSDPNDVDLSECLKMSLEMKKALVCKAVARV